MSVSKRLTLAAAVGAAIVAAAVVADDMKNGSMTMVEPTGKMSAMGMPGDKAMMDDMMKHAVPMPDGMVIMVWGQKLYVVKNEKMPDGKMTFDYWGLHGQR